MAKTIIQTIGPLYGEPVNGTVFGRPNGSIYVPPSNRISIALAESYRYVYAVSATLCRICDSSGTARYGPQYNMTFVAEAQDLATYVQAQLYEDESCTTLVASRSWSAGEYNAWGRDLTFTEGAEIVDEQTYYLRCQLMNNGNPVATSDVIEVVGVVNE